MGFQWCGHSMFLRIITSDDFFLHVQVNPDLTSHFEEKGFRFVGQDVEGERMEIIELDGESLFFKFISALTLKVIVVLHHLGVFRSTIRCKALLAVRLFTSLVASFQL